MLPQRWHTVHEARPNPFRPASSFHLGKFTFEGLVIGETPAAQYLSTLSDEERTNFLEAKDMLRAGFARGFNDERGKLVMSPSAPHVIHVNIGFIGRHHKPKGGGSTVVHADVKVLDAQFRIVDEFVLEGSEINRVTYHLRDTMYGAARDVGELTAAYLKERAGLEASP